MKSEKIRTAVELKKILESIGIKVTRRKTRYRTETRIIYSGSFNGRSFYFGNNHENYRMVLESILKTKIDIFVKHGDHFYSAYCVIVNYPNSKIESIRIIRYDNMQKSEELSISNVDDLNLVGLIEEKRLDVVWDYIMENGQSG